MDVNGDVVGDVDVDVKPASMTSCWTEQKFHLFRRKSTKCLYEET